MMVNVGMPELHSVNVISKHLTKTLVPDKSEAEARAHFHEKIRESLSQAGKQKFHDQIHNIRR